MRAPDFLQEAKETMEERGRIYDTKHNSNRGTERSMGKTVAAFNAITGHSIQEQDGWLLMLLLKQVRQWSSLEYHHDSAMDSVAYAALLAESHNAGYIKNVQEVFDAPVKESNTSVGTVTITEQDLLDALNEDPQRPTDAVSTTEIPEAKTNPNDTLCNRVRNYSNMGKAMHDPIYDGLGKGK